TVEAVLEKTADDQCAIMVHVLENNMDPDVTNYRVRLVQGDYEVESYLTEQGTVRFESVPPGEFCIEILKSNRLCGKIYLQLELT
ncbi:MAG: hypothetical protein K8I00_10195, partial [Candidatus Omnitrophica bacterium]|nr:hypothetical protein [Candidatus Omnitrophota bacterium]